VQVQQTEELYIYNLFNFT